MKKLLFGAAFACAFGLLNAATLPKATEIYPNMGLGWNLGNTMEVPKDPTAWGNVVPSADVIKAVKLAGFNTIRIPCAWNSHASNGTIDAEWLKTVKGVVDAAISYGMYVLLNSHWDEGWLEDHVFDGQGYDKTGLVNNSATQLAAKQSSYWKQIADYFKDYDEHLIFASANEPGVNDPWQANGQWAFTNARMQVLKSYHEACIKAVRQSGGNNATRTIIVQMPRTEIENSDMLANSYPTDPAGSGYTMAEAHFYPYQFAFMENDESWGKVYYYWESETTGDANRTCSGNATGSKNFIESQFSKLENTFVKKGIPVVIGEMGINKRYSRVGRSDFNLDKHLRAVAAWYGYTVGSAKKHGLVPCVWDTGYERKTGGDGDGDMTIIRRQAKYGNDLGAIVDTATMNAMKRSFGVGEVVLPVVSSSSMQPTISSSSVAPGASSSSSAATIQCEEISTACYTELELCVNFHMVEYCLPCESLDPECGYFGDLALPNASQSSMATLTRQGNLLVAQGNRAEIRLFDMNGNLIRETRASASAGNSASMDLVGLNSGMYIAKSGNRTLKVNVK